VRFVVTPPATHEMVATSGWPLAISPDGRTLVYVGTDTGGGTMLYRRTVDALDAVPIPGTAGPESPVFSPDGQSLAFIDADQRLRRVPLQGGLGETLATGVGSNGLAWGESGILVLGRQDEARGLSRVPEGGGERIPLTTVDTAGGEVEHIWPILVDDARTIIFAMRGAAGDRLAMTSVDGGTPQELGVKALRPLGFYDGVLVYLYTDYSGYGTVAAVPFDLARRRVTGPALNLVEGIAVTGNGNSAVFAGAGGALVYVRGSFAGRLALADLRGGIRELSDEVRDYNSPRFSPDGKRIAVGIRGATRSDIWIHDLVTGATRRLTTEGVSNRWPAWTPDGARVLYYSIGRTPIATWWQPADGSGRAELLTAESHGEAHVSPDGSTLIFTTGAGPTGLDLWTMPLAGARVPQPYLATPFYEGQPRFSPDGRWVAYASNAAGPGPADVYVRPYPGPGSAIQVSRGGGSQPVWARNGRRVFYVRGRSLFAANLVLGASPTVASRDSLLDIGYSSFEQRHPRYDVAPDGEHVLFVRTSDTGQSITVVLNWIDEVRHRLRGASGR
jgi:serine/threonine-protein kinase